MGLCSGSHAYKPRITRNDCKKGHGPMVKGSELLVAALETEGVDRIYGVPGEENLDVVESLRNSSIELILSRHEQVAASLERAFQNGGVHLVVVPIDYIENIRGLIDELREKVKQVTVTVPERV